MINNNLTKIEQLLLPFCVENHEYISIYKNELEDKLIDVTEPYITTGFHNVKKDKLSNTKLNKLDQTFLPFMDESTTDPTQKSDTEDLDDTDSNLEEDPEFVNVYSVPKKFKENKSNNFKLLLE